MINPLAALEINHFELRHSRVCEELRGATIAQVSDVHMGRWVRPRHLRQIVALVNARRPALAALTGDYIGYSKRDIEPCVRAFDELEPTSFAVLGNHDHWADADAFASSFERGPVTLLRNESRLIELDGAPLCCVGVDDYVTGHADVERAFAERDERLFCLALNHVPAIAPACVEAGADLVLSGHTHNFQFNIPRLTNRIATAFGARFFAGAYEIDDSILYINRGLGSASWPRRIRATPELTFITLERDPDHSFQLLESERVSIEHRRRGA